MALKPLFPVEVETGDLSHFNQIRNRYPDRLGFVFSGEFISGSNQMAIASALRHMGLIRSTTVGPRTGILIYTSDDQDRPEGKLRAAAGHEVPLVLNEAAAIFALGLPFHVSPERKAKYKQSAGILSVEERLKGSGRTYRLAMLYVMRAWENKGQTVSISDHFPTKAADIGCTRMVAHIIEKLQLRGFSVRDREVTFNGY